MIEDPKDPKKKLKDPDTTNKDTGLVNNDEEETTVSNDDSNYPDISKGHVALEGDEINPEFGDISDPTVEAQ